MFYVSKTQFVISSNTVMFDNFVVTFFDLTPFIAFFSFNM